jgi:hypothetical protein
MARPVLVGYDPKSADHAPVNFGVVLSRLDGDGDEALLVDASTSAP